MVTNSNVIYYEDNKGHIITSNDIENAFRITSGKYRFEDETGYLKFLYNLFGKSVMMVLSPSLKLFMDHDNKILAIKWYRDTYGGTLSSAREQVENFYKENGY